MPFDEQGEVVAAVARRRDDADLEVARAYDVAVVDRLVDVDAGLAGERMRETGTPKRRASSAHVDDVVAVVVRDEDVRDRDALPLDRARAAAR